MSIMQLVVGMLLSYRVLGLLILGWMQNTGVMSYVIERIDKPLLLGEAPHWDVENKKLYYVDVLNSIIYSYNPQSEVVLKSFIGNSNCCTAVKFVSLIVPIKDQHHKFVISYGTDIATVRWDEQSEATDFKIIASTPNPDSDLRFNDGKCSPEGILLAGTMEMNFTLEENAPGKSALYALKNGEVQTLLDDVRLSNGLAWSIDNTKLYYIDSLHYRIYSFDYEAENTKLSNRKTVFDFKVHDIPGIPDGMTIDKNGNLWVAVYLGGLVVNINPTTGELLKTITMPTSLITSLAFGGPNLDELYVTSASLNVIDHSIPDEDLEAGHLFKITQLETAGFPGVPAKI